MSVKRQDTVNHLGSDTDIVRRLTQELVAPTSLERDAEQDPDQTRTQQQLAAVDTDREDFRAQQIARERGRRRSTAQIVDHLESFVQSNSVQEVTWSDARMRRNSYSVARRKGRRSIERRDPSMEMPQLPNAVEMDQEHGEDHKRQTSPRARASIVSKDHRIDQKITGDLGFADMVEGFSEANVALKRHDKIQIIATLMCVVLEPLQRELRFHCSSCDFEVTLIRLVMSLCTIVTMWSVKKYYSALFQLSLLDKSYLSHTMIWTSESMRFLVFEWFICFWHSFPFINIRVNTGSPDYPNASLENPWGLAVFLRLYVVVRVVRDHYYTGGTKILGLWHNFHFDYSFVVKNMLHSFPFRTLLPMVVTVALMASYVFHICERGVEDNYPFSKDYGTALWVTLITMTGVGYGDIYAVSVCGRGISVFSAMTAIVMTAILVATIYSSLTLMPYESRMVEFLDRVKAKKELVDSAVRSIQAGWRLRVATRAAKNGCCGSLTVRRRQLDLVDALYQFQQYRRSQKSANMNLANHQLFRTTLEGINDKLTTLFLKYFDMNVLDDPKAMPIDVEVLKHISSQVREISTRLKVGRNESIDDAPAEDLKDVKPASNNTPRIQYASAAPSSLLRARVRIDTPHAHSSSDTAPSSSPRIRKDSVGKARAKSRRGSTLLSQRKAQIDMGKLSDLRTEVALSMTEIDMRISGLESRLDRILDSMGADVPTVGGQRT